MAVVESGVIPRKATLEAPVLPANRRKRRRPPGRTRESIPLSENHTPIPSPDRRARSRGRRPAPRSCRPLLRRRTRSLRRSNRLPSDARAPAGAEDRHWPMRWSGRPTPHAWIRGIAVTPSRDTGIAFTRQKSGRWRVRGRFAARYRLAPRRREITFGRRSARPPPTPQVLKALATRRRGPCADGLGMSTRGFSTSRVARRLRGAAAHTRSGGKSGAPLVVQSADALAGTELAPARLRLLLARESRAGG